jgi:hypothetical protein
VTARVDSLGPGNTTDQRRTRGTARAKILTHNIATSLLGGAERRCRIGGRKAGLPDKCRSGQRGLLQLDFRFAVPAAAGPVLRLLHCCQLSYESRSQNARLRAITKVQKIRRRLGGASLLELFPEKPRGMWWRTYRRLCEEAQRAEERTSPPAAMMKYLDKVTAK